MSIFKRKDIWWLDISTPTGKRIRRSTKTSVRKKAQEYHDKLKAELWDSDKLNKAPPRIFEEALLLFLKDSEGQRKMEMKKAHARYFREIFAGRELSSLTSDEITLSLPTHHSRLLTPLAPAT